MCLYKEKNLFQSCAEASVLRSNANFIGCEAVSEEGVARTYLSHVGYVEGSRLAKAARMPVGDCVVVA